MICVQSQFTYYFNFMRGFLFQIWMNSTYSLITFSNLLAGAYLSCLRVRGGVHSGLWPGHHRANMERQASGNAHFHPSPSHLWPFCTSSKCVSLEAPDRFEFDKSFKNCSWFNVKRNQQFIYFKAVWSTFLPSGQREFIVFILSEFPDFVVLFEIVRFWFYYHLLSSCQQ